MNNVGLEIEDFVNGSGNLNFKGFTNIEKAISLEQFVKEAKENQYEVYTESDIKKFITDVVKQSNEIQKGGDQEGGLDYFEKAKEDLSTLQRKVIDNNGKRQIVYVRESDDIEKAKGKDYGKGKHKEWVDVTKNGKTFKQLRTVGRNEEKKHPEGSNESSFFKTKEQKKAYEEIKNAFSAWKQESKKTGDTDNKAGNTFTEVLEKHLGEIEDKKYEESGAYVMEMMSVDQDSNIINEKTFRKKLGNYIKKNLTEGDNSEETEDTPTKALQMIKSSYEKNKKKVDKKIIEMANEGIGDEENFGDEGEIWEPFSSSDEKLEEYLGDNGDEGTQPFVSKTFQKVLKETGDKKYNKIIAHLKQVDQEGL